MGTRIVWRVGQLVALGQALARLWERYLGEHPGGGLPVITDIQALYPAVVGFRQGRDWVEVQLRQAAVAALTAEVQPTGVQPTPERSGSDGAGSTLAVAQRLAAIARRLNNPAEGEARNALDPPVTLVVGAAGQASRFEPETSTMLLDPTSLRRSDADLFNVVYLTVRRVRGAAPRAEVMPDNDPDGGGPGGAVDAVRTPVLGPVSNADADADADADVDVVDGFVLSGVGSNVEGVVGSSLVVVWETMLAAAVREAVAGLGRLGSEPDAGSVLAEAAAVVGAVLAPFGVAAVPVAWAVRDEVEELRSRADVDPGSNTIRLGRSDDCPG